MGGAYSALTPPPEERWNEKYINSQSLPVLNPARQGADVHDVLDHF